MKISEIYNRVVIDEFWDGLEEDLQMVNSDTTLKALIQQANELVFKKFNINPSDTNYTIVGSARLYLYPQLRDVLGLDGNIGDLDIVIPDKNLWIQAGLEDNWNADGIYRPTENIEVFSVWDPSRAGGEYSDIQVRSTQEVIKNSTPINGYNFMSLQDIIDYKISMNRDKEQDIVNLISTYQDSGSSDKIELLKKMTDVIGIDKTKEFLGKLKNNGNN